MKFTISMIALNLILINLLPAQTNKGIHFQAIARNENGIIIPNKQITLRISILTDSIQGNIIYQEIKSATTNMLGLIFIDIGNDEQGKLITQGSFNEINWAIKPFYLQVELDPNNALSFLNAGVEKINYVPLALHAEKAVMVETIVPIGLGGTGVGTIKELTRLLNIDKINNTPDSSKPISIYMNIGLSEKLNKTDTIKMSNRINLKLNSSDTVLIFNKINAMSKMDTNNLSNRINNKISIGSVSYTDIISGLGYIPVKSIYGAFYDTSKQITTAATATAIRFNFQQVGNKTNVTLNSAGNPTRVTVAEAGTFQINYLLQFIKSDAGTDELSIWIRKNSSAYPNTHTSYLIQGNTYKNIFSGNYFIELVANDYIELYYSIKNSSTTLYGSTPITTTPSRPATPSAYLSIHSIN